MVAFLALLAIQIGVIIAMRLFTPKKPRPKAAPFEAPQAEDGAPIPKVFGTKQISGQITLVRDKRVSEENDGQRHRYWARMDMALGWGPFDTLHEIISDEQALSLQRPGRDQSIGGGEPITSIPFPIALTGDAPAVFNIAALDMFGGGDEEGGLNGQVSFYRGTKNQPIDPLVAYADGDYASRYPHMAHMCFGTAPDETTTSLQGTDFHWTANNPTPKPISVIVSAYPHGLVDMAAQLGITEYTDPRIGTDANPMEIIYECFVNKVWGMGESSAKFNLPQLISKALQLKNEGRGLSTVFVNQQLDDFVDDVERHIRGTLIENPKTGLIEMQLLRGDYDPETLPVLTAKNTFDFKQHEGSYLETLNQIEVRYSKYAGGTLGPVADELVTDNAVFQPYYQKFPTGLSTPVWVGLLRYASSGRRMTNVSATRTRAAVTVTLTAGVDYRFQADDGWFQFFSDPTTDVLMPGDTIHVSYNSVPTFSGFIEATVSAQNLANFQITGSTRGEHYDYDMFSQESLAQETADFLKLMSGRKLAPFTWGSHHIGLSTKVGDVVMANELDYRLSNMPIRVTKRNVGTLENPGLRFEGIEDIFGERLSLYTLDLSHAVPTPHTGGEIDAVVTLSCLGGATRVGLFSTDPTLTIELWRATDDTGTGAVLIAALPGTTRYYDDPQTVGVEQFYAARLSGVGYESTELTEWMGCTASAGTPGEPTDELPTWVIDQSQTEDTGTATLIVTDPQSRVISVSRSTQIGTAAETDLGLFTAAPYTETVGLVIPSLSYIRYQITYVDLDDQIVTDEEFAVFDPNPPEPPVQPVPDAAGGMVILPFHTTLTEGAAFDYPGESVQELYQFGRRRIDCAALARVIGQVQIRTSLPAGARISWQYAPAINEAPVEEDWVFLDGLRGPTIAADAPTQIPIVSAIAPLDALARQDIIVRAVCWGGDNATRLSIAEMLLTFLGSAAAEDDNGDLCTDEDPCGEHTDNFGGYGDTAALDQKWVTSDGNLTPLPISWGLDLTGGVNNSRALVATIGGPDQSGSVFPSGKYLHITGLAPSTLYHLEMDVKTSWDVTVVEEYFTHTPCLPTIALSDVPEPFTGASSYSPTAAAHNAFEHLVYPSDHVSSGTGELWIIVGVTNGSGGGPRQAWFDNVVLTAVSDPSTVVSPCTGGPTIPGDGGFCNDVDDPCQDSTAGFGGYSTTAEAEADGWTFTGHASEMELDPTGGHDGGAALVIKISPTEVYPFLPSGLRDVPTIRHIFTGLTPGATYSFAALIKLSGDIANETEYIRQPGIFISISDNPNTANSANIIQLAYSQIGTGSYADMSLYFNKYKLADTNAFGAPTFTADGSGNAYFSYWYDTIFGAAHTHKIWIDEVFIMDADGNIVTPCSGGPTVPGDGGYYPDPGGGDGGGPSTPPIDPPETGLRAFGLWNFPPPFTGYPGFYGAANPVTPSYILSFLSDLKAKGFRAALTLVSHRYAEVNGSFNLSKYMSSLNAYNGMAPDLEEFRDMLTGFIVLDDIFSAKAWGLSQPLQWSTIDGVMAKRVTEIFPGWPTMVRASAVQIKQRSSTSRYVKVAWNQWTGPGKDGFRTAEAYKAGQIAACKSLNMRWMWGLNAANGGPNNGQITPTDIIRDGKVFAADGESFGLYIWASTPPYSFLTTTPYVNAINQVVAAMVP